MENNKTVAKRPTAGISQFLEREGVKTKFAELLGKRSTGFITSLLSLVNNSEYLAKATPETIYTAAMMAATLDLPINANLGFAYIIPYGDQAQFQMGYKGFIQLALRSGQFKNISAAPIYKGQITEEDPLKGFVFDWSKKESDEIVGYAAFFSLLNGFEKTFYMSSEKITEHGKKFSKNYNNSSSLWKKDFESMAMKTVLKLLLSKYAPMSIEMQRAVIADQSVINDVETMDVEYVDAGKSTEEINIEDLQLLYDIKKEALSKAEQISIERILENKEVASYKKAQTILKEK